MVLPYLLACFGALVAGSTAVAAMATGTKPLPPPPSAASATQASDAVVAAAVAGRMREHRAALDRVWGDGAAGGPASVSVGGATAARRLAAE